jgi:hypothetical protein
MNGQHACCSLQLCCRKRDDSIQAVAEMIEHDLGWSARKDTEGTGNARAISEWIFEKFDLVPKGLASAIVEAYEPHMKERFGK